MDDVRFSVSETLIRSIEGRRLKLHRKFPKSESLKNCMDRTIPYFTEQIVPEVSLRPPCCPSPSLETRLFQ